MDMISVPLSSLVEDPKNARLHPEVNLVAIKDSLTRFGQVEPLVVRAGTSVVVGGNGRLQVMRALGWSTAHVIELELSDAKAAALGVALNRTGDLATWNAEVLQEILDGLEKTDIDVDAMGLSSDDLDALLAGTAADSKSNRFQDRYTDPPTRMSDAFGAPPFSVLDARQGYWRARKDEWKRLGMFTSSGREAVVDDRSSSSIFMDYNEGVSIIDPVLCELLYAWYCPPGGQVVNPTAGESVYGIVAGVMGYPYYGVELRPEQIEVNRGHVGQTKAVIQTVPEWVQGNGTEVADLAPDADFIMCCPPYYDLEEYSDLAEDLSQAPTYEDFLRDYCAIVAGCEEILKPDRFAVFVVGDIRDPDGNYRNFVGDTVRAFLDVGMKLYNDAILLDPVGTLPLRAGRAFRATRKLGKAHQNVLVFLKGDAKRAAGACGVVTRTVLGEEP